MAENGFKNRNEEPDKHQVFFQLFTRNQGYIYSYILALIPQSNEVDDIFQEVAASLWEHFSDYKLGTDFTAWGLRIARNKVIDYIRKSKRSPICYSEATVRLISNYHSKQMQGKDHRIKILENCVSRLPSNDRRLVQLKYSQKITTKALSERIGRSVNGLYKSLSRIHYFLYKCIQRTLASEQ